MYVPFSPGFNIFPPKTSILPTADHSPSLSATVNEGYITGRGSLVARIKNEIKDIRHAKERRIIIGRVRSSNLPSTFPSRYKYSPSVTNAPVFPGFRHSEAEARPHGENGVRFKSYNSPARKKHSSLSSKSKTLLPPLSRRTEPTTGL